MRKKEGKESKVTYRNKKKEVVVSHNQIWCIKSEVIPQNYLTSLINWIVNKEKER